MLTDLDLSSELSRNKHFPAVDIVKFICAFLVVAIHIKPFMDVNSYLSYGIGNYIARLAVPFFFVAGGYFCFRKTNAEDFNSDIPISYAKRIIKLYLIWTVIYFPLSIWSIVSSNEGGVFFIWYWF